MTFLARCWRPSSLLAVLLLTACPDDDSADDHPDAASLPLPDANTHVVDGHVPDAMVMDAAMATDASFHPDAARDGGVPDAAITVPDGSVVSPVDAGNLRDAATVVDAAQGSADANTIADAHVEPMDAGSFSDASGSDAAEGMDGAEDEPDAAVTEDAGLQPDVSGATIEPVDVVLTTPPNITTRQHLTFVLTYNDGSSVPIPSGAAWESSDTWIASVEDDGWITATGQESGTVTITATFQQWTAKRNVQVLVSNAIFLDGLNGQAQLAFDQGTPGLPEQAPRWSYPEHETVYPRGLAPPVIQWDKSGTPVNTVYRLTVQRDDVHFTLFTLKREYQPTAEQWEQLAGNPSSPVRLNLVGKEEVSTTALLNAATERTFTIANAYLRGNVYYRQIATAGPQNIIQRIDPGATAPIPEFNITPSGATCHGCHNVSRDGSRLAYTVWNSFDPRAGLAWTTHPEPSNLTALNPLRWTFSSLHPGGTRAASVYYGALTLTDVTPGIVGNVSKLADVPQAAVKGCTPGGDCAEYGCTPGPDCNVAASPTFSPDGTMLAYIARSSKAGCSSCGPSGCTECNGFLDWNYVGGDLMVMSWDSATDTFDMPRMLVRRGDTAINATLAYPSWSPDSRWIAIDQGPTTARYADNTFVHLVDPISGHMTRLTRGAPDGKTGFPNFTPFAEGGYYWLVFHSKRPYGAITTKQLWVMAIDVSMTPGVDGSHPAFWLPGQDSAWDNIQASWSLPACQPPGMSCSVEQPCCNGLSCTTHDQGQPTCTALGCMLPAQPCMQDEDCCPMEPEHRCLPTLAGDQHVCQQVVQ